MTDKDYDLTPEEQEAYEQMQKAPEEPEEAPEQQEAEPKAEAEAESEAGSEEAPAEEEQDKKPSPQVPLEALDRERHRRRGVEEELQELRQQISQFMQAQKPQEQQPQSQPEEAPDPVLEPEKFKGWLSQQLEAKSKPVEEWRQQQERAQQAQQQWHQLQGYAARHEQAFREQHPDKDYDGALQFMRDNVRQNFLDLGYQPHEARNLVTQQEAQLTALAAQRGINPAAYVYTLATRQGFTEKPKPAESNEAEKVTRLADVQQRTKSSAGASAGPREDEYTLERLAGMSEKELAKVPEDVLKRVMGG